MSGPGGLGGGMGGNSQHARSMRSGMGGLGGAGAGLGAGGAIIHRKHSAMPTVAAGLDGLGKIRRSSNDPNLN